MKITEFGKDNDKTFLLLPGTSCTWECNFNLLAEPLSKTYHVLCANYTGFDDTGEIFDTQIAETARIEQYIQQNYNGHLDGVYGSSMGGSFASLLVQRRKIHIDHVFIGSSDLDQSNPVVAKLVTSVFGIFLKNMAKNPEKALEKISGMAKKKGMGSMDEDLQKSDVNDNYTQEMMRGFCETIKRVDMRSVKNQFYSDLVTKLDDGIDVTGTTIHVLYATGMGGKYLKRYQKHYANPDIVTLDYGHEGWLGNPELMIKLFEEKMRQK